MDQNANVILSGENQQRNVSDLYDVGLMTRYLIDTRTYIRNRCNSVCLGSLSKMAGHSRAPRYSEPAKRFSWVKTTAQMSDSIERYLHFLKQTIELLNEHRCLITSKAMLHEKIGLIDDRIKQLYTTTKALRQDLKWIVRNNAAEEAKPTPRAVRKRKLRGLSVLKRDSPDTLTNDDIISCSNRIQPGVEQDLPQLEVKVECDNDSIYSRKTVQITKSDDGGVAGSEESNAGSLSQLIEEYEKSDSLKVSNADFDDSPASVKSSRLSLSSAYLNTRFPQFNNDEGNRRSLSPSNHAEETRSPSLASANRETGLLTNQHKRSRSSRSPLVEVKVSDDEGMRRSLSPINHAEQTGSSSVISKYFRRKTVSGVSTNQDEGRRDTQSPLFGAKDYALLNAMTATSSELSRDLSSLSSSSDSDDERERRKKPDGNKTAIDQISKPCVVSLEIDKELNQALDIGSLERPKRRRSSSSSSHGHKSARARLRDSPESPSPSSSPSHSPSRSPSPMELGPVLDDFEAIGAAFQVSEPESDHNEDADRVILDAMVQSSNDDEVSEDANEVIEEVGKKVKKAIKASERTVSAWRRDALLTGKLSDTSDEEPEEEAAIKKDIEQINVEDEDSDVVIVEELAVKEETEKETVRRKRRNTERDNSEQSDNSEESEFGDVKPKVAGRRNIRTLLTDEKLTATTREANLREKERLERLEQKQKKLESSQISEVAGLVLDATEGSIISVHPVLFKRLKDHQVNGVKFMWNACYESVDVLRTEPGAGCVLAHCMGLGKTFQVVTLVHTLFSHPVTNTRHVLVVCPVSTVLNWQNEFDIGLTMTRSKGNINVFIISDSQKDRYSKLKVLRKWREDKGVLIMGYDCYTILTNRSKPLKHKLSVDQRSLELIQTGLVDPGPDLVICDEGHRLKNSSTNCAKALMGIKTLRRIILTGTPLQNNLLEYYSMVQFVKPDLLGTVKEFKNRFENPITNGQYGDSTLKDIQLMKKRSHVLHSILKDTVQRYEVTELQHYLPEKKEYVILVKLHEIQAVLYQKYINHFKMNRQTLFLSHFHLLQSTWTHPKLLHTKDKMALDKKKDKHEVDTIIIDDVNEEQTKALDLPMGWWKDYVPKDFQNNWDYGPKLKVMIAIIKECIKHKEKVLIFSSSIPVLDLIEHILKVVFIDWRICRDYLRMDGTVAPEQRQKLCNMFNQSDDDKYRVFLISHKVGGLGLNLVAANRVILMDVCWNPAIDTQSIFRVYRFGQTRPCFIYRLVSKDTMEEVAYKRSVTKQAISGRVVDEMQINRHYRLEDLREMYNFHYNPDEERPTPKLPSDILLANVIQELKKEIFTYHEHESLLVNMPEEELDTEDIKLAWAEFNKEKELAKEREMVPEVVYPVGFADLNNQRLLPAVTDAWANIYSRKTLPDNMATLQENTSNTLVLANPSTSNGVAYNLQEPTTSLNIGTRHSDMKENVPSNTYISLENRLNPVYRQVNLATAQEAIVNRAVTTHSSERNPPTHFRIVPTRQPIAGDPATNADRTLRVVQNTNLTTPHEVVVPFRFNKGKVVMTKPQFQMFRKPLVKPQSQRTAMLQRNTAEISAATTSQRGRGANLGATRSQRGRGANRGATTSQRGRGAIRGAITSQRGRGKNLCATTSQRGRGKNLGATTSQMGRGANLGATTSQRGRGQSIGGTTSQYSRLEKINIAALQNSLLTRLENQNRFGNVGSAATSQSIRFPNLQIAEEPLQIRPYVPQYNPVLQERDEVGNVNFAEVETASAATSHSFLGFPNSEAAMQNVEKADRGIGLAASQSGQGVAKKFFRQF